MKTGQRWGLYKMKLDDLKNAMQDKQSKASLEGRKNTAARTWKIGVDTKVGSWCCPPKKLSRVYSKTLF